MLLLGCKAIYALQGTACRPPSLAITGHKVKPQSEVGFVEVARGRVPAGLSGFHHRVARRLEVCGGVAAGRRIAAADMAADQAHPERGPLLAGPQALLATLRIGLDGPCLIKVRTSPFGVRDCIVENRPRPMVRRCRSAAPRSTERLEEGCRATV